MTEPPEGTDPIAEVIETLVVERGEEIVGGLLAPGVGEGLWIAGEHDVGVGRRNPLMDALDEGGSPPGYDAELGRDSPVGGRGDEVEGLSRGGTSVPEVPRREEVRD